MSWRMFYRERREKASGWALEMSPVLKGSFSGYDWKEHIENKGVSFLEKEGTCITIVSFFLCGEYSEVLFDGDFWGSTFTYFKWFAI